MATSFPRAVPLELDCISLAGGGARREGKKLLKERTQRETGERGRRAGKRRSGGMASPSATPTIQLVCPSLRVIMNRTKLIFPIEHAPLARIPFFKGKRENSRMCQLSEKYFLVTLDNTMVFPSRARDRDRDRFNSIYL